MEKLNAISPLPAVAPPESGCAPGPAAAPGEDLFLNAFQHAAIGMALVSPEGHWLKVNRSLCTITGYQEQELLGRRFHDITDPADLEKDLDLLRQLLAGEIPSYEMEKRYFHKLGHRVHVQLSVSLIRDRQGKPLYFISQIQDISERTHTSASLKLESALLNDLMNTSLDAIYFKDRQSRIIRANPAMARRHGCRDVSELLGLTDFDFFSDDHARQAFEDEQRIMATGEAILDKEEKEGWLDGRLTWVSSTKVPRRGENGEITGIIGISRDITDRKNAQFELERLNKQLMEISRQAGMSEIATSVLHNVGNVLTSVNVSCAVIAEKVRKARTGTLAKVAGLVREHAADLPRFFAEDPVGRKVPELLEQLSKLQGEEQAAILHEVTLLDQNIDHIKEIITVQQSYANVSGVTECVDLRELVEDAVRMNAGGLTRHQVDIVRDFQPAPAITVEKHKVLQILVNLVRNAKHALTDSGRPDKRLTLRIDAPSPDTVAVHVADNGIGIAPENMTRIFALGFTTKRKGHGFGLHSGNLAAREMGGSLTASSDGPGTGATFTLSLPVDPAASDTPK